MKIYSLPILILVIQIMGCEPATDPTRLDSIKLKSTTERIETLKKIVHTPSDIFDAEYHLLNANGFASEKKIRGIPAPSYWNYTFAVKIDPKNEIDWTNGLIEVKMSDDYDKSWTAEVIAHRATQWQTSSNPQLAILKENGLTIEQLTYVKEGIIFKKIIQE